MSRRKRNEDSSPLPPLEPNQRCRSHHTVLALGLAAAWRRGSWVEAGGRRGDGGGGRVAGALSHCTARMLHGAQQSGGIKLSLAGGRTCATDRAVVARRTSRSRAFEYRPYARQRHCCIDVWCFC